MSQVVSLQTGNAHECLYAPPAKLRKRDERFKRAEENLNFHAIAVIGTLQPVWMSPNRTALPLHLYMTADPRAYAKRRDLGWHETVLHSAPWVRGHFDCTQLLAHVKDVLGDGFEMLRNGTASKEWTDVSAWHAEVVIESAADQMGLQLYNWAEKDEVVMAMATEELKRHIGGAL